MSAWNHVEITCYRDDCGATIALHQGHYETLKKSGGRFYCPNGHGQVFRRGLTDDQKKIQVLERANERISYRCSRAHDAVDELARGTGVCPLGCGWKSRRILQRRAFPWGIGRYLDRVGWDLANHLIREHNATRAPVALLEETTTS